MERSLEKNKKGGEQAEGKNKNRQRKTYNEKKSQQILVCKCGWVRG
jgi:hypothetical protein